MSRAQSTDQLQPPLSQKSGSTRLYELESRLLREIQDIDHVRNLAYEATIAQDDDISPKVHPTEPESKYPYLPDSKPSTWGNVWYRIDPVWKSLTTRQKILSILYEPMNSPFGFYWCILMVSIVLTSVIITILQTTGPGKTSGIDDVFHKFLTWYTVELVMSCFLIIEFLGEVIVTPAFFVWSHTSIFWIKLISLLPFILETIVLFAGKEAFIGDVIFRAFMLCRIIRLFRLFSLSSVIREDSGIFLKAVRTSTFPLLFLIYYLIGSVLLFSGLIYFAETNSCVLLSSGDWVYKDASSLSNVTIVAGYVPNVSYDSSSDQKLCAFQSIPDAMWWSIVTMTTVGYGDKYPNTTLGKWVAALCMVVSLIMIPLPMTIFSANLTELYLDHRSQKRTKERAKSILEKYTRELEEENETETSEKIVTESPQESGKQDHKQQSTIINENQSEELSRISTLLELIQKFCSDNAAHIQLSKQGLDEMTNKQELISAWISEAKEKLQRVNVPSTLYETDGSITLTIDTGSEEAQL